MRAQVQPAERMVLAQEPIHAPQVAVGEPVAAGGRVHHQCIVGLLVLPEVDVADEAFVVECDALTAGASAQTATP